MRRLFWSLVVLLLLGTQAAYAKDLKVHFINVGQGDSILIETPDDKAILIDAGIHYAPRDEYNPFRYLKDKNISQLDAIFITHPHDDHYKGFKYLCTKKGAKEFPISAVYYSVESGPEYGKFEGCLDELINRSEDYGQISTRGPPLKYGEVVFKALYPQEPITEPNKEKNEDSIVMKIIYKNVSFMITGDADTVVEESLVGDLQSTVLKVGHHGSRTATSSEFLKKVNPKYAVISSNDSDGKGKTYGHPHEPTLDVLKANSVNLYRTDLSGNIEMDTDGDKLTIKVDRPVAQDDPILWQPGQKNK